MSELIGKTFDHYRIESELGRGGMGEVYLAEDIRLKRSVALKLLAPSLANNREALHRFRNEAHAAAELSHPNIATIHDTGEAEGQPYLVLEYVAGQTVSQRLAAGLLPLADALRVAEAVALGLAHAHTHGVIHRDIKSSNVMLAEDGQIKILDFGLAIVEDDTRVTQEGVSVGTISYMSPEQVRGEEIDRRTDLWSLGIVLFEMLTGQTPFARESGSATAAAIQSGEADGVSSKRTGLPLPLEHLIQKCLSKDPARRYQHADELAVDLREIIDQQSGVSQMPSTAQTAASGRHKRRPVLLAGLVLAVVAAVLVLRPKESIPFSERDWILLTQFDNQTGDEDFDKTLDMALEVSLQQSRYVNVFPRSRVQATLKRMERDGDTVVDESVGREIALRESIKILVAVSINQLGSDYNLIARIVDPEAEITLRTAAVRARGKDEVLSALDQLGESVRNDLGESLASITEEKLALPLATTSSFRALRSFSEGAIAFGSRRYPDAFKHYGAALAEDSTFALAHARLGAAYYWSGDSVQGEEHFALALGYQERLTERERLILQPHIDGWRANREKAIEGFKFYLRQYPDDTDAWHSLGYQHMRLRQCDEAYEAFSKVLQVHPEEASAYINIASCTTGEEALKNYEKAFELQPDWRTSSNLNHEFGFTCVSVGQLDRAEKTFRLMLELDTSQRAYGHRSLGLLAMYRGRYADAVELHREAILLNESIDWVLSVARSRSYLAACLRRMGDLEAARAEFQKVVTIYEERFFGSDWAVTPGCALARLGDLEGAHAMLRLIEENFSEEKDTDRVARERLLGEIALANGNSNEALEHFELALTIGSAPLLEEAAGRASDAMGLPEDALVHFEVIHAEVTLGWEVQEPWMDSHYRMGKIHLDQNRPAQALEYFDRLLEIWQDADDSFPLLQQLRDRRAEAQAQLSG